MPMPFPWMGGAGKLDRWPLGLNGEPEEAAVAEVSREAAIHHYLEDSEIPFYVERASYPLTNCWRLCVPASRLEEAKQWIQQAKEDADAPVVFLEDIEELWKQFPPAK